MNLIINNIVLKTLPYLIIGILLVFSISVLVEIHDINTEVEELRNTIIELELKNLKS